MALTHMPFFNSLSMPGIGMTPELTTIYTGGRAYTVYTSIIEAHLPQLLQMMTNGFLDLPMLSEILYPHLQMWGIHLGDVRNILKVLFGVFKARRMFFQGFHHTVIQHLERIFEQDLFHVAWSPLRRSRRHFLVLATLARITQSTALAHVLLEIYYRHWREILRTERAERDLYMWCVGLMELSDLISPAEVHNFLRSLASKRHKIVNAYHNSGFRDPRLDLVMDMLMQMHVAGDDGFRGRGRRRAMLGFFPAGPRARTMPPLRMPLLMPPRADALALAPAFPSPSPSMDLAMNGGFMGPPMEAEIDNLQMRQNMLEQEVDNLRQEVGVW
ncbi:hypothetical protein K491DRAFT_289357 [Lophiostoma macrostomum CBS 122681]|uniref:Uncharacterized protein n=1 Tax=Lophiostoma macrostomum CBS 122681 TaxID=1314788 RepID=A0A6A6TFT9_9PLEO|nr:hypothetical protein K491DRAFT_289357 [Lophiostoma macrostomum CBS 122681]